MVQPYDYRINTPDPNQGFISGLQTAANITAFKDRQELERAKVAAAQQALAEKKAFNADVANITGLTDPGQKIKEIQNMQLKYPQLSQHYSSVVDSMTKDEKQRSIQDALPVFFALNTGNADAAKQAISTLSDAYKNSGDEKKASTLDALNKSIDINPNVAHQSIGGFLANALGEDFYKTVATQQAEARYAGMYPAQLKEQQAKADKAAVDSKFAESRAVADLEKSGWDIYKIQQDVGIHKINAQIAMMNAKQAGITNDLKRQELGLKIDEMKQKRDDAVRNNAAAAQSAFDTFDNLSNTIAKIRANKGAKDVVGPTAGSEYYPAVAAGYGPMGASADERANAIADIDTLKSQIFLSQLKSLKEASKTGASGLGAITEKELQALMSSLQSISRKQGYDQFENNLQEIDRLTNKFRKSISDKNGIPMTVPNVPAAKPDTKSIDYWVNKYGGG